MKKRLISLIAALCIVMTIFPCGVAAADFRNDEMVEVLYIPLDNRPFNFDRVMLMAESLGISLIMPDEDLFSTKLDGQDTNENGTQYGDRGQLLQFLMDHAGQANVILLSLDQLLSGGLMNSRCMEVMQPVEMPDGSVLTEYDVIDYIVELGERKTIYVIDSVMRLAVSNEYGGYTSADYTLTRKYGMVDRMCLEDEALTLENVIANYDVASDGTAAYLNAGFTDEEQAFFVGNDQFQVIEDTDTDKYFITKQEIYENVQFSMVTDVLFSEESDEESNEEVSLMQRYLNIRERKLRLTDYAVQRFSGNQKIHYLLGVDDSAEGNTIHTNEINYLTQYLDDNDRVFSALDGLAQTAVAEIYMSQSQIASVEFTVEYFGDSPERTEGFNYLSVESMVQEAIAYHNGVIVEENPAISVLVYLSSEEGDKRNTALCDLIGQLNENEVHEIPTILIDLANSGKEFLNAALADNVHVGMLLSYSGKAEDPVQVQMAVSQGVARYLSLMDGNMEANAHESHLKNLLWSFVEEFYKTGNADEELYDELYKMGYSSNLGRLSEEEKTVIYGALTEKVCVASEKLLANFTSGNFISSLRPYGLSGVSEAAILSCEYPWDRQFEISCELTCGVSEEEAPLSEVHYAYTNGYTSGEFLPNGELTREQAAKLLVAVSGADVDMNAECTFTDVSDWAEPYVAVAIASGYLYGYDDDTFKGKQNMSRAEFAAMLVQYARASGITLDVVADQTFVDVPRDDTQWFSDEVYFLADAGVINGYADGTFQPDKEISRAEAVVLLNRFFGRTELLTDSLMSVPRYSDVMETYWAYQAIQEASITHFCMESVD